MAEPKMIVMYMGRNIDGLSREELIEALHAASHHIRVLEQSFRARLNIERLRRHAPD